MSVARRKRKLFSFLVVDGNGVAGYQAGEDYVFEMAEPPPVDLSGVGFFVLSLTVNVETLMAFRLRT